MVTFSQADLVGLSVHRIGNKLLDEQINLSDQPFKVEDDTLRLLLLKYYLTPFEKANSVYRFAHSSGNIKLNEIYATAKQVFAQSDAFHEGSERIAKLLYDISNHPKIKSGELHVVYFKDVQIEGDLHDAIGVFKSENKETYLKIYPNSDGFGMSYEQDAISVNRLDKGCLIFNTDTKEGFKVVVMDQTKNGNNSAVYWKDEFLQLQPRNDIYQQTINLFSVYKNWVTDKVDEDFEISSVDKIDLLNKAAKYFKEKETFDIDEFSNDVINNSAGITSFKEYKQNVDDAYELQIPDVFDISDGAVKKQVRSFKNIIKLDKNFHIYIHGNKELIEKGFDEEKSMNYYKVYFRDEN